MTYSPEGTNLQVTLVPVEGIARLWPEVEPLLRKATDLSGKRYTTDDIKFKLFNGEWDLWVVFEPGSPPKIVAAITSNFIHYPHFKVLHGQFLGGERLEEWRDKFCQVFDQWGRDNGCTKIEFTGRAGWGRPLASNGYRECFRVYERDLSDG